MAYYKCIQDNQYNGLDSFRSGRIYDLTPTPPTAFFTAVTQSELDNNVSDWTPLPARRDLEGDWHVDVKLTARKDLEVNGNLSVGGDQTVDGNLDVEEDLTVDGDIIGQTPSDYLAHERTGFVTKTTSEMSVDKSELEFTIKPLAPATEFNVFVDNLLFTKNAAETVEWTDVEGMHYIYYDSDGTLSHTTSFTPNLFYGPNALVAIFYWDVTNQEIPEPSWTDERHGCQMDGATHAYEHFVHGTVIVEGLDLTDIDADASGDDLTSCQFGSLSGQIADEDIFKSVDAVASTTGMPCIYLDGADANIRQGTTETGTSLLASDANGYLQYNEWTGSAWQLTEVGNNDFACYHVFVTTAYNGTKRMFTMPGQALYATAGAARNGAETEIYNITTGQLPFAEYKAIGTVIFQRRDAYGNIVAARIISTGDGDDYLDWRGTNIGSSGGISAPANQAADVLTSTTNFDGALSSADINVQLSLETLDDSCIVENIGFDEIKTSRDFEESVDSWRPIYMKMVDLGSFPDTTTKNVAHGVSNMSRLVAGRTIIDSGSNWREDPFVSVSTASSNVSVQIDTTNVVIKSGIDRSSLTGVTILEYTKTTDTATSTPRN